MRRPRTKPQPGPVVQVAFGWPERSCCCSAPPVVRALMPPAPGRDHSVELYLCGHHYRVSADALASARATVRAREDRAAASLALRPVAGATGALT